MRSDVVYVLYGGTSPDGSGYGYYETWTESEEEAKDFYRKNILRNPYSCGKVRRLRKGGEETDMYSIWEGTL